MKLFRAWLVDVIAEAICRVQVDMNERNGGPLDSADKLIGRLRLRRTAT